MVHAVFSSVHGSLQLLFPSLRQFTAMSSAQPGAGEKQEPSYYPGSPSWTSGEVQLDNNFGKMTIDPKILEQLAQVDVKTRERT